MAAPEDLARQLLKLARDDLTVARTLRDAEGIPENSVGFHAQQAVEKALKAAIASRGEEFPFTHDLGLLIQLCEDADLKLPASLADADRLTPYGAALRYGLSDPGTVDSEDALRWAHIAVEWADSQAANPTDRRDGHTRGPGYDDPKADA